MARVSKREPVLRAAQVGAGYWHGTVCSDMQGQASCSERLLLNKVRGCGRNIGMQPTLKSFLGNLKVIQNTLIAVHGLDLLLMLLSRARISIGQQAIVAKR